MQLENSQLNVDDTAGHRSVRVPLPLRCAGDVGLVSATGESRVITTLSVVETFKICDTATATRSLPVPPAVSPLRLPVQMMRMSPLSPKQRRHSHLWRQPRTVGNLLVSREIASFTNGRVPCNNSRLRGKWPGVFFTRVPMLANYRYLVINTCATGCEKRLSSEESMWRVDEESFSQPVSGFTTCLSGMYRPFLRPILLIFHTGVSQSI